MTLFLRSISGLFLEVLAELKTFPNVCTWSIPSGQWRPQSCFLFIVSRKVVYRRNDGGRKYEGNVKEAVVSMQKRFSYNQTFTTADKTIVNKILCFSFTRQTLYKEMGQFFVNIETNIEN